MASDTGAIHNRLQLSCFLISFFVFYFFIFVASCHTLNDDRGEFLFSVSFIGFPHNISSYSRFFVASHVAFLNFACLLYFMSIVHTMKI